MYAFLRNIMLAAAVVLALLLGAARTPPALAADPVFRWPWALGEGWGYNTGPHDVPMSLDFQPIGISECTPAVDTGHVVHPMAPGTVTQVAYPTNVNGANTSIPVSVVIDHGNGWSSYTTHLANTTVNVGSVVNVDTALGNPSCYYEVNGGATGVHVHVGLSHNGPTALYSVGVCGWTLSGATPYPLTKGSTTAYPLYVVDANNNYNSSGHPRGTVTNDNCSSAPPPPPPALGLLKSNGDFIAKQGALDAGWVTLAGAAKSIAVDGNRFAMAGVGGQLYGKDGIYGGWVLLEGTAAGVALSGDRIGLVKDNGDALVKDGLSGLWVTEAGGMDAIALSGDRIAVLQKDGTVFAKDGVYGGWVTEIGGAQSMGLDGNNIGVLLGDGTLIAKAGIAGTWTTLEGGIKSMSLGGGLILAVRTNHTLIGKSGIDGTWTTLQGEICSVAVGGTWIVAIQDNCREVSLPHFSGHLDCGE